MKAPPKIQKTALLRLRKVPIMFWDHDLLVKINARFQKTIEVKAIARAPSSPRPLLSELRNTTKTAINTAKP